MFWSLVQPVATRKPEGYCKHLAKPSCLGHRTTEPRTGNRQEEGSKPILEKHKHSVPARIPANMQRSVQKKKCRDQPSSQTGHRECQYEGKSGGGFEENHKAEQELEQPLGY